MTRPLGAASLALLVLLYLVMIFAEFIAPYPISFTSAEHSYHPPNGRFYKGVFSAQEFRVTNTVKWEYSRIRGMYSSIHFFAHGEPYKLLGVIPSDIHLFTTEKNAYPVFLMGADNLGRDLFSRIVYGSRISLTIGLAATLVSLLLAVMLGGISGYFGGFTDWSVMRLSEFFMLIPGLYLILFFRSLLSETMDSGQAYMMITLILSLVGWPGSARTVRGMVHAIKREDFILNAQLEMIKPPVIILRHIIPQISSLLIVSVALSIPGFILTETTLSYLGLGITDPAVSWGSLIKRDISTVSNLRNFPWLLNPVWFLLGVTLAFNFLGDCLRDFYDPYHTIFRGVFKKKSAGEKGSTAISDASARAASRSAADSAEALVDVRNLFVNFTVLRGRNRLEFKAVRGVSFSVRRGEILGIVGESGSGKSVSVLAIPRLLPPNARVEGSVLYEGSELTTLAPGALRLYRGRKIGMIFQEPGRSFDPLQNIGGIFFETFRNSMPEISKKESAARAVRLLSETGLPRAKERLSNFPHQFSGGQLQRIGIALALAQNCELLIADEPTTALDVTIQKQIVELLRELRRTRDISIIFISHDIDLVSGISDKIMVMYGGLVMEAADTKVFLRDGGSHPYTKALLAASPRFGSHYSRERLAAIPGKVTNPARPEPGCPFAPRCPDALPLCSASIPPLQTKDGHGVRCCVNKAGLVYDNF